MLPFTPRQGDQERATVVPQKPNRVAQQQPQWRDAPGYRETVQELAALPALVMPEEIDLLHRRLADAAAGKVFLLQGGDCAETFEEATAEKIGAKVQTLLQMAAILTDGASLPVVRVGRMAGQFTKPRSSDVEERNGLSLPAYRGDMVNGHEFSAAARQHDPKRMLQGYRTAALTLRFIRAFLQGGNAELQLRPSWSRDFDEVRSRHESWAAEIDRAFCPQETGFVPGDAFRSGDFFVSHEALLLDYERALLRVDQRTGRTYAGSGHFLWVGERTRRLDGAHIDFLSRVENPIGVKLSAEAQTDDVMRLVERLNPDRRPGRLTLIIRMGKHRLQEHLPPLIERVQREGAQVLWVTDPMHGNTVISPHGYKTRYFDDIQREVREFFAVHRAMGTVPGGLHVEMTGEDVAECLGGLDSIGEEAFATRYESLCDPRLNHLQALEVAFLVTELLARRSRASTVGIEHLDTASCPLNGMASG